MVEILLAGRSSLAMFPTGGGKSLCYQLPALLWPGVTLVVSPLMALMREQVDFLQEKGVAAARLDSSLDAGQAQSVYERLRKNEIKILYVAPERFANERFRHALANCQIELLAIDEAHCISEWGHNFRPDYLKLARLANQLEVRRSLALTATATPKVARDIQEAFGVVASDVVQTGFRRANLAFHVTPCAAEERDELLKQKVAQIQGAVIVYVTLQHTAETVAGVLQRAGFSARAYHAGMRAEAREEVQNAFMDDDLRIVVATIAFGMGIDKGGIRAVFHYNLPKTVENFVQEVGRAGRDGQASHCEVLACLDDLNTLENFVYSDTPDQKTLKSVLEHVLLLGEDFDLSLYQLSRSCDVKPAVVETVLAYLEVEGWIESRGAFYAERSLRFLRGRDRVLAGCEEGERDLLAKVFATGREGRSWLHVSLEEASQQLEVPTTRIAQVLDELESYGDLLVKPSQVRRRFRRLQPTDSSQVRELSQRLGETFAGREERDISRLESVLAFLASKKCLTLSLLQYFGEEDSSTCGHCSVCRGSSAPLGERSIPELSLAELAKIQEVIAERQAALRSSRQLARFFCGITSPASAGARLKRHSSFGILSKFPFLEVLTAVQALGKTR